MEPRIKLIKKTEYILYLIVVLSLVFIKPADVRSADEVKSVAQADQQDIGKTDNGTLPLKMKKTASGMFLPRSTRRT